MNDTTSPFVYRVADADGIDAVEPLWQKLRAYHAPMFQRFEDSGPPFVFEPRKQGILRKAAPGKLRVELVSASTEGADIAYAISSVGADGCGEVDSLFVEEQFRGCGIGTELLRHALAWFDSVGTSSKVVTVAYDNAEAVALYRRFGFLPRTILLQQSQSNK